MYTRSTLRIIENEEKRKNISSKKKLIQRSPLILGTGFLYLIVSSFSVGNRFHDDLSFINSNHVLAIWSSKCYVGPANSAASPLSFEFFEISSTRIECGFPNTSIRGKLCIFTSLRNN